MKLDQFDQDRLDILEEFKLRMEFKQWVNRMQDMYINYCDEMGKEPTTIGFTDFCGGYED